MNSDLSLIAYSMVDTATLVRGHRSRLVRALVRLRNRWLPWFMWSY